MTKNIQVDIDGDGICVFTIDVPDARVNTLSSEVIADLSMAVDRAQEDSRIHGIVLRSGKKSFIAGANLKNLDAKTGQHHTSSVAEQVEDSLVLSRVLRRLETCGKPVAVVINGAAAGGGFEVALACHYRVAIDHPAVRVGLPEVTVGLIPGAGGTQRLPRLIGVKEGLSLLQTGRMLRAAEAEKLGLVDAILPGPEALEEAKRWVRDTTDPGQPWDKRGFTVPGGAPSQDPGVARIFRVANAATLARTKGNIPAPMVAASAVWEGLQLPFDMALELEGKYFHQVFTHPSSRALIRTMFVSKHAADRLSMRPRHVPQRAVTTVGIIGAGKMGAGLALAAASVGIDTVLMDTSVVQAQAGKAYASESLSGQVQRGRMRPERREEILNRISSHGNVNESVRVDFVIEAVPESFSVKEEVFKHVEKVLPGGIPIASSTSGISITQLASTLKNPERFVGMHFFSPAERAPLVEIIRGVTTSTETFARALDLVKQLGKTPIIVNDKEGFFTTRFIASFIAEGLRMVEEGVAPALVENGARLLGMAQGPLSILDRIGLDVDRKKEINRILMGSEAGNAHGSPTLWVAKYSHHRIKSGAGFYDYSEDDPDLWEGLAELVPVMPEQPPIEEVKTRLLYAQLAEGARAFAQGVVAGAPDGDLGAVLGVGFPAFLGGPFVAIDEIGVSNVVKELYRLEASYGAAFSPPELLEDMARLGRSFYGDNAVEVPVLT